MKISDIIHFMLGLFVPLLLLKVVGWEISPTTVTFLAVYAGTSTVVRAVRSTHQGDPQ